MDSQLAVNVMVAVILGCTLAVAGAYLIEFLDDSFKSASEVHELLGVPVLTAVPTIRNEADENKLIMLQTTPARAMEAYRLLRVNLEFTAIDTPIKLIVVVGASAQDGKSLTAANLASAYARAGKRTILVDADLHRPTQQRLFKLVNNIGLTTALRSDGIALESLLQSTIVPGMRVLTSGPLPPNPAELLSSKRMQELLSQLKAMADFVIIDSPPLTTVTDGIVLVTQADGTLMVVRAGKTHRASVKRAHLLLQQVKARLLGVVYNGIAINNSDYRTEYGYYRYRKAEFPTAATSVAQPAHDFDLTPQKSNGVLTLQQRNKNLPKK
jgi:capsular exopolysaccharide synthesis family protein